MHTSHSGILTEGSVERLLPKVYFPLVVGIQLLLSHSVGSAVSPSIL